MNPVDYIIIAVIAAIVCLAVWYVIKAKKSGKKCIGCPDGCCPSGSGGCCGCSGKSTEGCDCGCGGEKK